jgi:hypothetical protein
MEGKTDPHLKMVGRLAYRNIRGLLESLGCLLRVRGGYTRDEVDGLSEWVVIGVERGCGEDTLARDNG